MLGIARTFSEAAGGRESWPGALSRIADSFGAVEAHLRFGIGAAQSFCFLPAQDDFQRTR